jgi:hypothetical protein
MLFILMSGIMRFSFFNHLQTRTLSPHSLSLFTHSIAMSFLADTHSLFPSISLSLYPCLSSPLSLSPFSSLSPTAFHHGCRHWRRRTGCPRGAAHRAHRHHTVVPENPHRRGRQDPFPSQETTSHGDRYYRQIHQPAHVRRWQQGSKHPPSFLFFSSPYLFRHASNGCETRQS